MFVLLKKIDEKLGEYIISCTLFHSKKVFRIVVKELSTDSSDLTYVSYCFSVVHENAFMELNGIIIKWYQKAGPTSK